MSKAPDGDAGFVVWVNGGYGVGKSSVLEYIGDLMAERRLPFSLMDVDWFHRSWPVAAGDSGNFLTETANMAAVWANYRTAGPRQLVISGVLSPANRPVYEQVLGLPVRSIRLVASPEITATRLISRYSAGRDLALGWHLERFEEVARQLRDAEQDEAVFATDDRLPLSIAVDVLRHFDLVGPAGGADSPRAFS